MKSTETAKTINSNHYSTDVAIPIWKRWVLSLNDFGGGISSYFVSAFLVTYFTGVAMVPMASISLLLVVVRIFDAINDPIIGALEDRTNWKNRYRPWVIIGNIAMAILVVVLYTINPEWADSMKIAWVWIFYILWTVASTVSGMAYKAFCGVVTSNGMERAKLGSVRGMMTGIASALPGIVAVPMIMFFSSTPGGMDRQGYFGCMLVFVAISLPLTVFPPLTLNEKIRKPKGEKIPLKAQILCLVKNPPMLFCIVGSFLFGLLIYGRVSFLFYFMQYNAGNVGWYSIVSFISVVASFSAAAIVPYIFKLLKNKGWVCAVGLLISGLGSLLIHFFHNQNIVLISIFYFLVTAGATLFSAMNMALVGDSSDNAELMFGVRVDGFLNSSVSMAQKFGGAISPAVGTAMLAAAGFIAGGDTQPASVLSAISVNSWLIPAILCLLGGLLFFFYKMTDAKHKEIVAELDERRKKKHMAEQAATEAVPVSAE